MSVWEAFDRAGQFFKGNLHMHSTLSDGALPPMEVCARYRDAGYDFVSLTDHFVGDYGYPIADTTAFRTNRFTTILGAEMHSGAMADGEIWHLLAIGLPPDFAPPIAPGFEPVADQESAADLARRARDAGAFVAIPHPQWSNLTLPDARLIAAAHAIEVYNHGCAIECDRGDGAAIADLLMNEGRDLQLIATDDAHFHTPDHFGGWVMARAEANEPEALLQALKDGAYYASQGPEIYELSIRGDEIDILCSPVERAIAVGPGTRAASVWRDRFVERSDARDRIRLPLDDLAAASWLRVTVVDAQNRRAWSNPLRRG